MPLVIVESPTKARKLKSYLDSSYVVAASVGHIRDLPKTKLGVDVENNFEPTYEISKEKTKVIAELRSLASKSSIVYLATDPDREGEAIAWHVKHILEEKNGKKKEKNLEFKRATFHEITKKAVVDALTNPGEINSALVDAQQARRVVDRLVGYEVSPVLWKKIRRGLSAGRVQSVALRLIVEREEEIEAFKPEEYWEVDVAVSTNKSTPSQVFATTENDQITLPESSFIARVIEVNGANFEPVNEQDVTPLMAMLPSAQYQIIDIDKKTRKRSSLPPFTTSTLQQRAATNFGYSSKQTMRLAQQLYEEGLITYHRTDSVSLSADAIAMARAYILEKHGARYVPEAPRVFRSTSKNAQEAHEAIRVTDVWTTEQSLQEKYPTLTPRHRKLYQLIWRRFVASQMPAAEYNQTKILLSAVAQTPSQKVASAQLKANGSVVIFDGWTHLFPDKDDAILPDVSVNQEVSYLDSHADQKFTQPPPRYNDASLVKELEKRGIGRPSTYASIISVLEDRGYVERQDKRFFATAIGITVLQFLIKHFTTFMEYEFTAEMEEDLDRISRGEKEWKKVISDFYAPFHERIASVSETAERAKVPVESTGEPCPECGATEGGEVVIRSGRFGKFKSCSRFPDCRFTQNIVETLVDVSCPLCKKGSVVVKKTRWGKPFYGCSTYPTCDWASWKQPQKGESLTIDEWKIMQEERQKRIESRSQSKSQAKNVSTSSNKTVQSKAKKQAKKKTAKKRASTTKRSSKK